MKFLTQNHFDTSTAIVASTGTLTVSNILGRNHRLQYVSDGDNSDATTTTITITFDEVKTISNMALIGMNWKDFTVYYDGATASTFSMTSTAATTTSDWSSNSETSMFLTFNTTTATTVTFDVTGTQTANAEKAIGHIYIADLLLEFDRIPSAQAYKPQLIPKQIMHKLSDGGVRLHTTDEKFRTKISLEHITKSFRDNLKTVYDLRQSFGFVAFPTTTGWDEVFYECSWSGPFTGFQYSDNAGAAGYSIDMDLWEITRK